MKKTLGFILLLSLILIVSYYSFANEASSTEEVTYPN